MIQVAFTHEQIEYLNILIKDKIKIYEMGFRDSDIETNRVIYSQIIKLLQSIQEKIKE
jgi:hypothetical protein